MGENELVPQAPTGGVLAEVGAARAAQEVQAAMVVAQRFPRDQTAAIARITESCKRPMLAAAAQYSYPKGGMKIVGPSIRLAEVLAQCWGNLDFGIAELEQGGGASTVQAYCHDMETNVRSSKTFRVPHVRSKKSGNQKLTDPRDIYELVANQGARRLRACILAVIPGDVQDLAIAQCTKTLLGDGSQGPLIDRVRKMVTAFAEIGVTQEMIERRLGHRVEACNPQDLVGLTGVWQSLKDAMGTVDQFFEHDEPTTTVSTLNELADRIDETIGTAPTTPTEERKGPRFPDVMDEPKADELFDKAKPKEGVGQ